ncbi:AGAP010093-PA [Anopheles gambiae str. PEST]|uniref:protein-tyrosine-phosphatase n=1 Tax=Anopheles gambiae TaxID=7165 RepID=Q5TNW7_ANOGA|nr:AGAP010093-PA [Anopheles gambiae str. PEST]
MAFESPPTAPPHPDAVQSAQSAAAGKEAVCMVAVTENLGSCHTLYISSRARRYSDVQLICNWPLCPLVGEDQNTVRHAAERKVAKRSLQIDNSEESDMGKYECVAENSIGTEHTKPTPLYVKVRRVPPTFSRPPEPVYEVMLGANLTLTCVAVGSPMPSVKWRKGVDQDLTPENDVPVGRNVLELTDIRVSTNYTCIAQSSLGVIEATSLVKVQSLPAAPTDVTISEVTATQVRLEWSYKGPEDLQYYVIQYKPKNANQASIV